MCVRERRRDAGAWNVGVWVLGDAGLPEHLVDSIGSNDILDAGESGQPIMPKVCAVCLRDQPLRPRACVCLVCHTRAYYLLLCSRPCACAARGCGGVGGGAAALHRLKASRPSEP